MQFPNALEGVKKLYKAEIIALISGICAVLASILAIAGVIAMVGGSGGGMASLLGGGVLLVAVAVLAIISFIMNIAGLSRAKADEPNFRNALFAAVVGIVASALLALAGTSSESLLGSLGDTLTNICSFLTTYFVCTALIALADRLGNGEMRERGRKARSLLTTVYVIGIVLGVLGAVFERSRSAAVGVVAAVILLVSAVLDVVAYVLYLKLLSKARTMLEA